MAGTRFVQVYIVHSAKLTEDLPAFAQRNGGSMSKCERESSKRALQQVYLLPNEWFLLGDQTRVPSEYVLYYGEFYSTHSPTVN